MITKQEALEKLYRALTLIEAKDNERCRGGGPTITVVDLRLPRR